MYHIFVSLSTHNCQYFGNVIRILQYDMIYRYLICTFSYDIGYPVSSKPLTECASGLRHYDAYVPNQPDREHCQHHTRPGAPYKRPMQSTYTAASQEIIQFRTRLQSDPDLIQMRPKPSPKQKSPLATQIQPVNCFCKAFFLIPISLAGPLLLFSSVTLLFSHLSDETCTCKRQVITTTRTKGHSGEKQGTYRTLQCFRRG